MKHLFTVCIIVLLAYAYPSRSRPSVVKQHEQWMVTHGITYANDSEKVKRFQIFKEDLEYIDKFNKEGNNSYTVGLNAFADLTEEEFYGKYTANSIPDNFSSSKTRVLFNLANDIPKNLDWREKGAVTPIKDQKDCDACWAFAAVAAVQGIWKIKNGGLLTLSEQQLIDCDPRSHGCDGGYTDNGFRHIIESDGILEEYDYPYHGKPRVKICELNDENTPDISISSYTFVQSNDERQLLRAVAQQPVSVDIAARGKAFQKYNGGIFQGPCALRNTHSVTIIGYGEEKGVKYWLIKNSWGKAWGINGYMKIIRQAGGSDGHCGIAIKPVYPTL